MNHFHRALVVTTSIPVVMGSALAKEPLVLSPSSSWNMNYANESCQLARTFGVGDQKTLVQFERFGPGEYFTLLISSKILKFQENFNASPNPILHPTKKEYRKTLFQFLPVGQAVMRDTAPGTDETTGLPVLVVNLNLSGQMAFDEDAKPTAATTSSKPAMADLAALQQASIDLEKGTTLLRVEQPMNQPIVFALGSLGPAFGALRACTDDLLRSWGLPVDPEHAMARGPTPLGNPGTWFEVNERIGAKMWNNRENSIIYFRMIVDEKGTPENCIMQDATQTDEFRDLTCKALMKNARFNPAVSAGGLPVRGVYRSSLRYLTPRNPRQL